VPRDLIQEGGKTALAFHFGPSTVRRIEDAVFFGWLCVTGLTLAFGTYVLGALLRSTAFIPLKVAAIGLIVAGLISFGFAVAYNYITNTEREMKA